MNTKNLITRDGQVVDPDAFLEFVAEYPKGQLGLMLSEGLAECINATQLYGKGSTLSLKVSIAPGEAFFGELIVKATVDTTPAKPAAPAVTFFPTPNGGLSRRDPNQSQLPGTEHA